MSKEYGSKLIKGDLDKNKGQMDVKFLTGSQCGFISLSIDYLKMFTEDR